MEKNIIKTRNIWLENESKTYSHKTEIAEKKQKKTHIFCLTKKHFPFKNIYRMFEN